MLRRIAGFHVDAEGDWVAELSCLHDQHVRHRPPFFDRPWVLTEDGRTTHLGTELDCPLCERAELPEGLVLARTAGPWDETTIPAGLLRPHRVADGTWVLLRVISGEVDFDLATDPPQDCRLQAGDVQPIPPVVAHHLTLQGATQLAVDFLVRAT